MKAVIRDREALLAVSPAALSAYARDAGWAKVEPYGDHSDVYNGGDLPEIILPRTQRLGDYANVVSQLIEIFAKAAEMDELSLYRDLATADRDVIRVRAADDGSDGSIAVSDGIALMGGAYDMLLAAACSLQDPRPLYHRPGANREANDYLRRVHLGQTEQGSFVVTLLPPVVPPRIQPTLLPSIAEWELDDDPVERRMTKRLAGALAAIREATERTVGGDAEAFFEAVAHGVSANLCEALGKMIKPFPTLDVSLVWARTRPMPKARDVVRFAKDDAPILEEAARLFRNRAPQPNMRLYGLVRRLKRDGNGTEGTIFLQTHIDGQNRSVLAVLNRFDYERVIQAHKEETLVVMDGDLERAGRPWRLLNPSIVDVILRTDTPEDSE